MKPSGLINYWLGWAEEGMSGLYDKIRHDVEFRKEVAEKAGLGFELSLKNPLLDRMDRNSKMKWFWKWLQVFDSREINGAPKGTILELFLTNSCQACHRLSSH